VAKKCYVVWQGRSTGVFNDWETCRQQVDKFPGARFKSFPSRDVAEAAFSNSAGLALSPATSAGAPARRRAKTSSRAAGQSSPKTYTAAEADALQVDIKIFTDGGCEPNPGEAGSGMAVYRDGKLDQLWYGLYNRAGTNNTAELNALHQAMLMAAREIPLGKSVSIFCDSKYAIQCVTQWAVNWEKKGWKKASGEIKNLDLIKTMFALHQILRDQIQVLHVNGHVGVQGNELADRMSILAIARHEVQFTVYDDGLNVEEILAMRTG
jgi:ribonuclease HI